MDFSGAGLVILAGTLCAVIVQVLKGVFGTSWFKGHLGEWLVRVQVKFRLPAETYRSIHNITLLTPDGTTQIDHVIVSEAGIFVVETKNMKGWIFGSEKDRLWTQQIYKHRSTFQNPLRQNFKHVKALASALNLSGDVMHSVVAFVGRSKFKTKMPPNVRCGAGFISYIKSFQQPVFSTSQVQSLIEQISSIQLPPTQETHRNHVQALKDRHDSRAAPTCPKCGSAMVLRRAKTGKSAGQSFWGCSAFPRCRMTRHSDEDPEH